MKISTRCKYGVRALIRLAQSYNKGPLKRKEISKEQNISLSYLENILVTLRKVGIVRTQRGASGGFGLAKPPQNIKMLEVISVLEGSLAPIECVESPSSCSDNKNCRAYYLWHQLYQAQLKVLENMTLQDLVCNGRAEWVI